MQLSTASQHKKRTSVFKNQHRDAAVVNVRMKAHPVKTFNKKQKNVNFLKLKILTKVKLKCNISVSVKMHSCVAVPQTQPSRKCLTKKIYRPHRINITARICNTTRTFYSSHRLWICTVCSLVRWMKHKCYK